MLRLALLKSLSRRLADENKQREMDITGCYEAVVGATGVVPEYYISNIAIYHLFVSPKHTSLALSGSPHISPHPRELNRGEKLKSKEPKA